MVSLNLLDGTAPLARERKAGMSKRFLIVTGSLTGVLFISLFFLEVIFAAFGLGEGTVFFKPEIEKMRVSQDEFAVINREKATAHDLFFGQFKKITSGGATYSLIKLNKSSQILAQGWVNSQADADYMFGKMRELDQWNLIFHQVYDKERSKSGSMKFMYKADFTATPDNSLDFKSAEDLPPLDSLNDLVEDVSLLAEELDIKFKRKPTILKTVEESSLHEYVYTMEMESSIASIDSFFKTLFDEQMPIIFDKIELRPASPLSSAKCTFRILIK